MELSPARRDGVMEAMKRYSSMVYRLAYARTRNHADAEDIYQEVFLKLARADISFENQEHVKAWLLRVTVNCSVNLFRSAWRRHVQTVEALSDRASPLIEDERYEALNRALDILPARYRAVIHLYYCKTEVRSSHVYQCLVANASRHDTCTETQPLKILFTSCYIVITISLCYNVVNSFLFDEL